MIRKNAIQNLRLKAQKPYFLHQKIIREINLDVA